MAPILIMFVFSQYSPLSLTEEQHEEFRTVSVVDYGAYILVRI